MQMLSRIKLLIKLFKDFGPLLPIIQKQYNAFINADSLSEKLNILIDALANLAKITPSEQDDKLFAFLEAITSTDIFQFLIDELDKYINRKPVTYIDGELVLPSVNENLAFDEYEISNNLINKQDNTLALKASAEANRTRVPWGLIIQVIPVIIKLIMETRKR